MENSKIMTKFKVLMYGKVFVALESIHDGIYSTPQPKLIDFDKNMDSLKHEFITHRSNHRVLKERGLENLDKCQLISVALKIL